MSDDGAREVMPDRLAQRHRFGRTLDLPPARPIEGAGPAVWLVALAVVLWVGLAIWGWLA